MEDLQNHMSSGNGSSLRSSEFLPKPDVAETEKQFEIVVDLTGLKPEPAMVVLKNGELWISGAHREEKEEKGKALHGVERHQGTFRKVLSVPAEIDESNIEATAENGVLRVVVPKIEQAKPKQIKVQA